MERTKPTIQLAMTGDVMLGRLMNEVMRSNGTEYVWGDTVSLLRDANLTFINLECVIARDGRPWTRTSKVFHFRAEPIAIEALKAAGIDYVSLANNHTLDYEEGALLEMTDLLDKNGIAHAGAGRDLEEASRPAFLQSKGIKVAVVSFTNNEPAFSATAVRPGTNYIMITTRGDYFERVRRAITQAREGGADVLVFSIHWGPNMRERPPRHFKEFARAVIDAGADIFCGHSAHIFQGIEIYENKPIFYDMGDFVDDYAVDEVLRNDQGFLCLLSVSNSGVERVRLVPTLISEFQVNRALSPDFEAISTRIESLSAEMGTTIQREVDHLNVIL